MVMVGFEEEEEGGGEERRRVRRQVKNSDKILQLDDYQALEQ